MPFCGTAFSLLSSAFLVALIICSGYVLTFGCQCQGSVDGPSGDKSHYHEHISQRPGNFSFDAEDPLSLLADARLPFTGGFLLTQTNDNEEVVWSGVSVFHQLHCLDTVRAALLGVPGGSTGHEDESMKHDVEHLDHCLEYIAQALVCAADDAIEPSYTNVLPSGKKLHLIAGIGAMHQCRDFQLLRDIVLSSQERPMRVARQPVDGDTLQRLPRARKVS